MQIAWNLSCIQASFFQITYIHSEVKHSVEVTNVRFLRFSGARKLEYWLKWIKCIDLSNRKLTRNYSSIASKQRITIIKHHISFVHPPCTRQLISTPSIHALIWERHSFQFIMIPPNAFVFLFKRYFSFIGKRGGETSSILSLNMHVTL